MTCTPVPAGREPIPCDLAAVVGLERGWPLSRQRSRGLKQALQAWVRVEDGWRNIAAFWRVLETNLARRHNSAPTHSLAEIEYLHDRFPGSFFLVVAKIGDSLVGGDVHTIEGPVMQGRYTPSAAEIEWCERRLLARIHRLTIGGGARPRAGLPLLLVRDEHLRRGQGAEQIPVRVRSRSGPRASSTTTMSSACDEASSPQRLRRTLHGMIQAAHDGVCDVRLNRTGP
jgi:hypothetical protein